jgi:hypothetical protein
MENNLFSKYASSIRALNLEKISNAQSIPSDFLLGKDGELSTHYIPFDYVNTKAKVVLVGITPGFTQWKNAMIEAQKQLLSGASENSAWIAAKRTGAFSGTMRNNLINLLDAIGSILGWVSDVVMHSFRATQIWCKRRRSFVILCSSKEIITMVLPA